MDVADSQTKGSAAGLTVATPDGARLAVSVEGEGPPLMLVSGLGGTAGFWAPCLPALARACTVIRLDQRGIGASSRGEAPLSIELLAADCLAVADALGFGRFHLVGHSTGGAIGQAAAWAQPERLASLTLSGAWLGPSRHMQALFGARRALLDASPQDYAALAALMAYPPGWLEARPETLEQAVRAAPADPAARAVVRERIDMLLAFDGAALAHRIGCPALILGARDDVVAPPFLQKELHAALPHARAERLPDGGHFFPVTRTAGFTAALLRFLEHDA